MDFFDDLAEEAADEVFDNYVATLGAVEWCILKAKLEKLDAPSCLALESEERALAVVSKQAAMRLAALNAAMQEEVEAGEALSRAQQELKEVHQLTLDEPSKEVGREGLLPRSIQAHAFVEPLNVVERLMLVERDETRKQVVKESRLARLTRSSQLAAFRANPMLAFAVAASSSVAIASATATASSAQTVSVRTGPPVTATPEAVKRAQAALLVARRWHSETVTKREHAAEAMRRHYEEQARAANALLAKQKEGAAQRRRIRAQLMREDARRFQGLTLEQELMLRMSSRRPELRGLEALSGQVRHSTHRPAY